jgi:hypothetical protein
MYQLEHAIADPLMLPSQISLRDLSEFVPPHRVGKSAKGLVVFGSAPNALQRLALWIYARARYLARMVKSHGKKAKRMVWSHIVRL